MYSFFVNGCQVSTSKKQSLLRFLRDEMHLTSVKDGCSQGACGACTVLIDGETCKACVLQTDRLEGRSIITVDGYFVNFHNMSKTILSFYHILNKLQLVWKAFDFLYIDNQLTSLYWFAFNLYHYKFQFVILKTKY